MLIGYARTSTLDQTAGLDAQRRELENAGCEKLFIEQVSSVDMAVRQKLAEALDYAREGDTLVVTKLDRLARSVAHLVEITTEVDRKGASLRILDMNIDTGTATGKLLLNIVGSIGEFERSIMLERQREGIAKAKAEGRYLGRPKTAQAKAVEIDELHREGVGVTEIAKRVGVGRSSVYRILEKAEPKSKAK